jgi:hypothetical protein
MKRVMMLIFIVMLNFISAKGQEENTSQKTKGTNQQLLGDDNRKAKRDPSNRDSNNQSKNRVSGNPNNRSIDDAVDNNKPDDGKPTSLRQQKADAENNNGEPGLGMASGADNASQRNRKGKIYTVPQKTKNKALMADSLSGTKATRQQNMNTSNLQQSQNALQHDSSNSSTVNTPGFNETSSSESGSPSVISGDNGKARDGTNNVQRADYNTGGAKIERNLSIGKKNTERDEKEVNKNSEQPVESSRENQPKNSDVEVHNSPATDKETSSPSDRNLKATKKDNPIKNKGRKKINQEDAR